MPGKRILLLEDDTLIGMDMAMSLQESGYVVDGPVRTQEAAFELIRAAMPDLAVLDVNLGQGSNSFDVALTLKERDIPLIFLTGYSAHALDLPDMLVGTRRLGKPILADQLSQVIQAELSERKLETVGNDRERRLS